MSMVEWAFHAVGNVTGGKSKKNKARDASTALDETENGDRKTEPSQSRSSSTFMSIAKFASKSTPAVSHVTLDSASSSIPVPWSFGKSQSRKVVKALYDFEGASDELSFKAGAEITVLNEVLDDWWMGEMDGQTGLFPTSYAEVLGLPSAHSDSASFSSPPVTKAQSVPTSRRGSLNGRRSNVPTPKRNPMALEPDKDPDDRYLTSDVDDDDLARFQSVSNASTSVYGAFDNHSKTSNSGRQEGTQKQERFSATNTQNETGQIGSNSTTAVREGTTTIGTQRNESKQTPQRPATPKRRTFSLLGSLNTSFIGGVTGRWRWRWGEGGGPEKPCLEEPLGQTGVLSNRISERCVRSRYLSDIPF